MELKIEKKCEIDIEKVVDGLCDDYLESCTILESICTFIEEQLYDEKGNLTIDIDDFPEEQTGALKTEILHQFANKLSSYKFTR